MTARDPANREPAAAQCSVFFKCFDGVRGAAWIITARRRQERRQRHLISADEQNQHGAHTRTYGPTRSAVTRDSMVRTSRRSASTVAAYASRRARIEISSDGCGVGDGSARSDGSSSMRTSSRSRRFNWLRSTVVCLCRGTTIPTRGQSRGEASTRTSRCTVRIRFPSRMTDGSSRLCVSRLRRGKPRPPLRSGVLVRELYGEALPALLRRRLRTARPHLVSMRVRNPWVLIRRLLRGR